MSFWPLLGECRSFWQACSLLCSQGIAFPRGGFDLLALRVGEGEPSGAACSSVTLPAPEPSLGLSESSPWGAMGQCDFLSSTGSAQLDPTAGGGSGQARLSPGVLLGAGEQTGSLCVVLRRKTAR